MTFIHILDRFAFFLYHFQKVFKKLSNLYFKFYEVRFMRYEKPQAEVMEFDFAEFMMASGNGPGFGHTCSVYTKGSSCAGWTTTAFGGGNCSNYDGKKCYGYSDGSHSNCREYGISCSNF